MIENRGCKSYLRRLGNVDFLKFLWDAKGDTPEDIMSVFY